MLGPIPSHMFKKMEIAKHVTRTNKINIYIERESPNRLLWRTYHSLVFRLSYHIYLYTTKVIFRGIGFWIVSPFSRDIYPQRKPQNSSSIKASNLTEMKKNNVYIYIYGWVIQVQTYLPNCICIVNSLVYPCYSLKCTCIPMTYLFRCGQVPIFQLIKYTTHQIRLNCTFPVLVTEV